MSYSQIIQKTRQEHMLFSVLLELTYQCNLDCFYCYNEKNLKGTLLRLPDYQRLLDDLAAMGTMNITLSGGEPLAHPDFMAIGRHARDLGFVVRIKSNGHALDEQRARRIQQEIDPFVIDLSLHGASAATHDRQTCVPGSFDRLQKNIETLQGLGMRLWLNCTLTSWNEHETESMFELADRLGIVINIDDQVTGRDDGDLSPLDIRASTGAQRQLLALKTRRANAARQALKTEIPKSKEKSEGVTRDKGQKLCGAGSSTLLVDPFGNVFPCVNWRRRTGNILERSIKAIWQQSKELADIRIEQVKVRDTLRERGDLAQKVSFCPGIAEHETGDSSKRYDAVKHSLAIRTLAADSADT